MRRKRIATIIDPNDKATKQWLTSQKSSTRSSYQTYWSHFLEFAKMTGDQILADRKSDQEHKWERLVLQFKQWMQEKGFSDLTATTSAMAARGFFQYHYMPLNYRRAETKKLGEGSRKTEDYKFSVDDLKRMADVANLQEKYVVVAGKSFGLRASDFLNLRRGDLEPYIDRQVPIGIGQIATQKEKVPAYPFIDSDAQPVIKLLLQQMDRKGRTNATDKILTYKWEKELSAVVRRLATNAGIKYGSKRVRFHCLRKFLIDRLSSHMSTEKWKQIVGKKIAEGAYVSADSLREDYQRTMVDTAFAKAASEDEIELRAAQRALEMQLNASVSIPQHIKEQLLKKIRAVKKMENWKSVEEEVTDQFKNSQRTPTNNNCADGQHCQRLVGEDELPGLFLQGWRVAAVLPSGKIVVSNE